MKDGRSAHLIHEATRLASYVAENRAMPKIESVDMVDAAGKICHLRRPKSV
jgi:hypothetical protein